MKGIYPLLAVIIFLMTFLQFSLLGQGVFTANSTGDWSSASTWTMDSGSDADGIPDSNDDATIANGVTVALTAATSINNFTIDDGGIFDYDGNVLTIGGAVTPFISDQSGDFGTGSTWLNGSAPTTSDKAIIIKGHTVTSANDQCADLYINTGAVLSTGNNKNITVTSSITVDGTVKLNSTNPELILTTGPVTVAGTGTIDATGTSQPGMTVNATATVASGSDINIIGDVEIAAGITLTLEGAIIVDGSVTGLSATSQLTLGTSGGIEINGTLLATGELDASGTGSTVEYNNSGAQNIREPEVGGVANSYYNLTISGSGTKTFPSIALDINGTLSVLAGTLDVNSQNINIAADWSNSGTISNLSTVTFDGTSDQSVTTNATNYVNATVNKSSGTLNLNEDVTVTGTLTMTAGNINTNTYSLTLGSGSVGTFTYTAGRIIGAFGRYISDATTSQVTYPIGTSSDDRTVAITFDDGGTGGGRSPGVVFAQFIETDPGAFASSPLVDDVNLYNTFNEGYWNFTVSGFTKGMNRHFDLALTGDGFSSFTVASGTRMVTRETASDDWTINGTHNTVSSNTVSRNDITTFPAQFAFGDDTNCTGPSDPVFSASVTEVCTSDTNDTYTVTLNSGNTYQWTVVGGTIDGQTNPTGFVSNLNSIDVDWGGTGQVGSVSIQENDPTCTSSNVVTLDVNINSIAPTNITGSSIVAENSLNKVYSVSLDANTSYNWTVVGGTIDGQTNPTGAVAALNSVTVDWGSNGAGSVSVTATKTSPSCLASSSTVLNITKYIVVDSDTGAAGCTGNKEWSDDDCWATGVEPISTESATITSGDAMELKFDEQITNLIVAGTLDLNNNTLTVTGDLEIPSGGNIIATGGGTIVMSSSTSTPQAIIDGTGTFTAGDLTISNAAKTISSTAVLTIPGAITINAGLTLTNEGTVTLSGVVNGGDVSSTFTNAENANVTFSSATAPMSTGVLEASATGNTVTYSNGTGVTIKTPASSYYNLEVSTGTQTLGATTDVNGGFTLTSGTFAMGANDMTVAGNLTYTAGSLTSTGTITLDGAVNQVVDGSWTIPNLAINNSIASGDAITFSSPVTVSTALTLTDGIVGTTSVNILRMSTTTAPTGFSDGSFINGPMVYDAVTSGTLVYPIGKSDSLHRADLTVNSSSSNFQAEFFASNAQSLGYTLPGSLDKVSFVSYWTISSTVTPVTSASVQLYYIYSDGVTDQGNLRVAKDDGSSNWVDLGGSGSASRVGSITSGNFTTFSDFALANASGGTNALPVELMYFNGTVTNYQEVLLNWATASELDNDYFEVQRSTDGVRFEIIGEVGGNGTSQSEITYSYTDDKPSFKAPFYRLRQVDFDGVFEYSEIIKIDIFNNINNWSIYPNPTSNCVKLVRQNDWTSTQNVSIKVNDFAGRQINVPLRLSDQNDIEVDLNMVDPGIYVISVLDSHSISTHKIVKN